MAWQTKMDVFSPYPWRCKSFQEMNDHTDKVLINDETGEWECAFYCAYASTHRIVEEECLGDECPCCELVGFDDYMKELEH